MMSMIISFSSVTLFLTQGRVMLYLQIAGFKDNSHRAKGISVPIDATERLVLEAYCSRFPRGNGTRQLHQTSILQLLFEFHANFRVLLRASASFGRESSPNDRFTKYMMKNSAVISQFV